MLGRAIRLGEQLYALANQPKRFERFPDGGHADLDAMALSRPL